jgi:hypothetical protein
MFGEQGVSGEVRTEAEGVRETAFRFTQLVLHPSQLGALNHQDPVIFAVGPPGCGKSLVAWLKALGWLKEEKHVQVVSTWALSLAASHLLYDQLILAQPASAERVHLHLFDLDNSGGQSSREAAVKALLKAAQDGSLFIVADEMCK